MLMARTRQNTLNTSTNNCPTAVVEAGKGVLLGRRGASTFNASRGPSWCVRGFDHKNLDTRPRYSTAGAQQNHITWRGECGTRGSFGVNVGGSRPSPSTGEKKQQHYIKSIHCWANPNRGNEGRWLHGSKSVSPSSASSNS